MTKGMSSRQLRRKHGVDVKEVFSLYDQFKDEISEIEGNVAKNKTIRYQKINVHDVMKEMNIHKDSLTVKEILGMLKGKMKTLDEKMFELKQENEVIKFQKKPTVTIHTYSEKAHD